VVSDTLKWCVRQGLHKRQIWQTAKNTLCLHCWSVLCCVPQCHHCVSWHSFFSSECSWALHLCPPRLCTQPNRDRPDSRAVETDCFRHEGNSSSEHLWPIVCQCVQKQNPLLKNLENGEESKEENKY
jgi:hypothetical protein